TQRGDAQGAAQCVQTVQMFGKLLQCSAVQLEMTLFQRGESQGGQVALHGQTMGQRLWYLLAPCLANRAGGPDPMSRASHRREPGTGGPWPAASRPAAAPGCPGSGRTSAGYPAGSAGGGRRP